MLEIGGGIGEKSLSSLESLEYKMRSFKQRAASRRNLAKARAAKTGGLTTMAKFVINKSADLATGGAAGILSDANQRQKWKQRKKRRKRR